MLAPKGLFILVLPTRVSGKLLFGLCKSCMETKICQQAHIWRKSDPSLARGSQINLKKALGKGHEITEMYEAWYFETIFQYNTKT